MSVSISAPVNVWCTVGTCPKTADEAVNGYPFCEDHERSARILWDGMVQTVGAE